MKNILLFLGLMFGQWMIAQNELVCNPIAENFNCSTCGISNIYTKDELIDVVLTKTFVPDFDSNYALPRANPVIGQVSPPLQVDLEAYREAHKYIYLPSASPEGGSFLLLEEESGQPTSFTINTGLYPNFEVTPGEKYIIEFYQFNPVIYRYNRKTSPLFPYPINSYGVELTGTNFNIISGDGRNRSNPAPIKYGPDWERIAFLITPTSSNNMIFNFELYKLINDENQRQRYTPMLLIDGLRIFKEGECNMTTKVMPQDYVQSSFKPTRGNTEAYVISAWVKEEVNTPTSNYTHTAIGVKGDNHWTFRPSGPIIDGWQQIYGSFYSGLHSAELEVELINESSSAVYFDDIRIHPYQGNMKSFVYDPKTQRLMAELDEKNYATFYEYDKEGGLVRVKKETEGGIYTIQETRSGNSKLYLSRNEE